MVTDAFGLILQELAKFLNLKELHADSNHCCLLKFKKGLQIHIEPDRTGNLLIIGCDLGVVPQGRYREAVFREALKANGILPPPSFYFAFSPRVDKLVLMGQFPLSQQNGEKVFNHLLFLLKKGEEWKEALSRGEIPSPVTSGTKASGMFGLRK